MFNILKQGNYYPSPGTVEFLHKAVRGAIPGVSRVVLSGYNAEINASSFPEDIWGGDGLIPVPAGNESWEIIGGANDTAAGTGARTVTLTTLDNNYVSTTQTVTLNGATAVVIPGNCRFINSALVATAGSTGKASQALIIRVAGAGAVRAYVATEGALNQVKYTVPDNFRLDMHSGIFGVRVDNTVSPKGAVFNNVITNAAGRQLSPLRISSFSQGSMPYRHEVAGGLVPFTSVAARNSVSMRISEVPSNGTQVDCSILCLLYDLSLWSFE